MTAAAASQDASVSLRTSSSFVHRMMTHKLQPIDVPYSKLKIFHEALEQFLRNRPREWLGLTAFRADRVETSEGTNRCCLCPVIYFVHVAEYSCGPSNTIALSTTTTAPGFVEYLIVRCRTYVAFHLHGMFDHSDTVSMRLITSFRLRSPVDRWRGIAWPG